MMHEQIGGVPQASTGQARRYRRVASLGRIGPALLVAALTAAGMARLAASPVPLGPEALDALYTRPLPPPPSPMRVYHLGHSLVGRDMPAMLAQLAGEGHGYESQLGWGATLKAHWGDDTIAGHAEENAHPRFRPAAEAVDSGDYDAVVLTEMVEIRAALRYHDSPAYLRRWAGRVLEARPDARVFLYETWHELDDPEGWLSRLDRDSRRYWEGELLAGAQAPGDLSQPVHVIPAGQVMARFARAVAELGGVEGVADASDLFADTIHVNDLGAYLVALTHYAVLYQRSPVGLPRQLLRADGTPADAPGPETARLMQQAVWEVVTGYPKTGVPQATAGGATDG
jgi:hypothetical protein